MMVYVDEMRLWPGKSFSGKWCHMWADTLEELHDMADKIGLKRSWFQSGHPDGWKPDHYDLRTSKRIMALDNGAIVGNLKNVYRKWKEGLTSET